MYYYFDLKWFVIGIILIFSHNKQLFSDNLNSRKNWNKTLFFQPFSVDSEKPDYDMDSDDEVFLEVRQFRICSF